MDGGLNLLSMSGSFGPQMTSQGGPVAPQAASPTKLPRLEPVKGVQTHRTPQEGPSREPLRVGSPLPSISSRKFADSGSRQEVDDWRLQVGGAAAGQVRGHGMSLSKSVNSLVDDRPKVFNPEPLPFHSREFSLSQRDRLELESSYQDQAQDVRKNRPPAQHRANENFLLGGTKIVMFERDDVMTEIRSLKGVLLPTRAKDLYVGRGFKLPGNHNLNKPRRRPSQRAPQAAHGGPAHGAGAIVSCLTSVALVSLVPALSPSAAVRVGVPSTSPPRHPQPSHSSDSSSSADFHNAAALRLYKSRVSHRSVDAGTGGAPTVVRRDEEADRTARQQSPIERTYHSDQPDPLDNDDVFEEEEKSKAVEEAKGCDTHAALTSSLLLSEDSVRRLVDEDRFREMAETFRRLDTDIDGHLKYEQFFSALPEGLRQHEERFIKQVYDLSTSATFFGLSEFSTLMCVCDKMLSLSKDRRCTSENITLSASANRLSSYMALFQSFDRMGSGQLSHTALREIIAIQMPSVDPDTVSQTIMDTVADSDSLDKISFLAILPVLLSMEEDHEKN